tara:strand:+ start:2142 stop:3764 length:1623 start_codon:yes stop_codon:yes gene_type:complete
MIIKTCILYIGCVTAFNIHGFNTFSKIRKNNKNVIMNGFVKGWSSAPEEYIEPIRLERSSLPKWIDGVLVRNGPALFEVGSTRVNHQFDGFAKLNKFNFSKGNVYYQSRFLRSNMYNRTMNFGKLMPHFSMLPTIPRFTYLDQMYSLLFKGPLDNNNINIHMTGDTIYATSDSSASSVFDINTLETIRLLDPLFTRHISAAHPQKQVGGNDTINYLCDPTNLILRIYRDSSDGVRTFIGHVKLDHVPLIHSFAVTKDYVIIFHYPLDMNTAALVTGACSVVEIMRWMKDRNVVAYVFDLHSSYSAGPKYKFNIPPFFSMHCINAFQENYEERTVITVDLIAYPDAEFIASKDTYGTLDLMRDPSQIIESNSHKMTPEMRRIQMNIPKQEYKRSKIPSKGTFVENSVIHSEDLICTMNSVCSHTFEMPCINKKLRGSPYQFVYGITTSHMFKKWGITKTCIDSTYKLWTAPANHFPSEPIFVPKPKSSEEDDGVVLSIVLDGIKNASYILCLDAHTMNEISTTYLPVIIPFDVHGKWFANN